VTRIKKVFKFKQNYETIGIEICNNDVIKNSTEDWDLAVANAKEWLVEYLNTYGLTIDRAGSLLPQAANESPLAGTVLLLRHYDITGKICPKPFLDDEIAWKNFVEEIAVRVG